MLYTYAVSIYQSDLETFLSLLTKNDEILLIQDGVLAVLKDNHLLKYCLEQQIPIYALIDDVLARGLKDQVFHTIKLIDYGDFVDLTVKHPQQIHWGA
ncbi:sulfurtransferase complex subunit TusB [Pseudomonas aeruginosa]|uniref:sulfurtransferase complex subunit TusB n=1 Tax=Pseudomonas aeruginosa TaxID=287 RepID=UPI000EF710B0|nr:sulfurtransferase complex subunit TusB [Pseudomonas aeruginosa]RLR64797.1 sulfurtransferase complex subunit TusB [Pseudomonas aeruginosa]